MPAGTVIADKYRVEQMLGRGGMGVVVEATHLELGTRVAIKLLLPELVKSEEAAARFRREGRALFKLNNPHVCRVMDVGTTEGGSPFMVMELLEGEDLAEVLGRGQTFAVTDAVHIILQASQGLAEAHANGVVHRDLKPENLYLTVDATGESCVKILDFGLSKIQSGPLDTTRSRKLTADAQVMGTPHYMAPEQWMSSKDVGAGADQWSLATILFELISGQPPFPGPQFATICSQVLNAPTPSLAKRRADVPKGLDAVLRKAMEKDPGSRYENVGAFAVALSAFGPDGSAMQAERTLSMLRRTRPGLGPESTGRFRVRPQVGLESDMQATMPMPQKSPLRGRSDTASSWQKMSFGAERKRSMLAVGLAVATLLTLLVVSFALVGGDDVDPPAAGVQPAQPLPPEAPSTEDSLPGELSSDPTEPTDEVDEDEAGGEEAAPPAAPSSRPKAKPAAKPAPKPVVKPVPRKPQPKPTAEPKTKPPPPPNTDELFQDR